MTKYYIAATIKLKNWIQEFISNEDGMGIVEIALIIVILITLALLFKEKITAFLEDIFDKFDTSELFS